MTTQIVDVTPNALARIVEGAELSPSITTQIMEKMGPLVLQREERFAEADKILALDPLLPSTQDKAEACRKAERHKCCRLC